MSNLVFNIKDNEIEIFYVKKRLRKIIVDKKFSVPLVHNIEVSTNENSLFNTPGNVVNIKKLLQKNNIKNNKVNLIFSMEGIITREVDVPSIKKRNLSKFIKYNMNEYFTINKEDFFFDYKITSEVDSEKIKYKLLLVAIPREKTKEILDLITSLGLKIEKIDLYPNCIMNLYTKTENTTIGVLDISNNRGNISIIRDGSLFLYSQINIDIEERSEEEFKSVIGNFNYFLNFYASRNYGNKVDALYLIGEYADDPALYKVISQDIDIEILIGYNNHKIKVLNKSTKNKYDNMEVVGSYTVNPVIYNKDIEFKEVFHGSKKNKGKSIVIALVIILSIITLTWTYLFKLYINKNIESYNTEELDKIIEKYEYAEDKINLLNTEKEILNNKKVILQDIKSDDFNYMEVFNVLKSGLPSFCRIKFLSMEKEKVNVILEIMDKKTIDVAKVVIALNKLEFFEPVEIQQLEMDDTVEEITLELKIKK